MTPNGLGLDDCRDEVTRAWAATRLGVDLAGGPIPEWVAAAFRAWQRDAAGVSAGVPHPREEPVVDLEQPEALYEPLTDVPGPPPKRVRSRTETAQIKLWARDVLRVHVENYGIVPHAIRAA